MRAWRTCPPANPEDLGAAARVGAHRRGVVEIPSQARRIPDSLRQKRRASRRAALYRENAMPCRSALTAAAALLGLCVAAGAQDAKKYPAFEGMWDRGSPLGSWDPTKPPGRGQ